MLPTVPPPQLRLHALPLHQHVLRVQQQHRVHQLQLPLQLLMRPYCLLLHPKTVHAAHRKLVLHHFPLLLFVHHFLHRLKGVIVLVL